MKCCLFIVGRSSCTLHNPLAVATLFTVAVVIGAHDNNPTIDGPRQASAAVAARQPRNGGAVVAPSKINTESRVCHIPRGGVKWPRRRRRGTTTIPESVSNLIKSIVGVGILGLPGGIAAFGDAPDALIPALAVIGVMGLVSAYTFSLIGQVCSRTGASSYGEAWEKSVGKRTAWIPSLSCAIDCFGGNVSFSMVLADTFKRLFEATVGRKISRTQALLAVTVFVLLPLCLLKNLSSLAPFSLIGVLGTIYTAVAMGIRFFDGSYRVPGGEFLSDLPAEYQPTSEEATRGAGSFLDPRSFILISMLSKSFSSHFVAPQFHHALLNNTTERFRVVVLAAFGTAIALSFAIASFGFLTFGGSSSGLILNNYSPKDKLIGLGYAAAGLSVLFSYPICFSGGKDGLIDLMGVPTERRTDAFRCLVTVIALLVITAIAAVATDLSTSLALRGATLGNALVYVYPALMFRAAVKKKRSSGLLEDPSAANELRHAQLATACAVLGIATGILGTKMALERWRGA